MANKVSDKYVWVVLIYIIYNIENRFESKPLCFRGFGDKTNPALRVVRQ